jgi:hypothetical protein
LQGFLKKLFSAALANSFPLKITTVWVKKEKIPLMALLNSFHLPSPYPNPSICQVSLDQNVAIFSEGKRDIIQTLRDTHTIYNDT